MLADSGHALPRFAAQLLPYLLPRNAPRIILCVSVALGADGRNVTKLGRLSTAPRGSCNRYARNRDAYQRFLCLRDVTDEELTKWKVSFMTFLRKLTHKYQLAPDYQVAGRHRAIGRAVGPIPSSVHRSVQVSVLSIAVGKDAIAAYHKFLTGQPLVEKPFSMDNSQFRIRVKMKRVRTGIERWHASGKDPSAVGKLMEGAQPLANAGKLAELEKLVDQALEILGETEKVPEVYGGE